MITKLEDYIKKVLPRISLIIVCLAPVIDWIINFFQSKNRVLSNPYSSTDFNLILLIALLNLIHDKLNAKEENRGDESNILLNRNQSDYYEIWEVCKKNRKVTIEAYGHTFKTLWYNFIKKFLNDAIINNNYCDYINIRLVFTRKEKNCYDDIIDFYDLLDNSAASKLRIELVENDEVTFFTGICINREYLWLSIREPFKVNKTNEHVREWRKNNNITSKKIINWFIGIIDYYFNTFKSFRLG